MKKVVVVDLRQTRPASKLKTGQSKQFDNLSK